MKAAYADPPYLGCGTKHYGDRHEAAAEYDDPEAHRRLIERLCDEFDCWALSLHEPSLRALLMMCPEDVRVGSWVKPFAAFKANVTRAWTWEPVIFRFAAGRERTREQPTWRDHLAEPIAMMRGFPGAKPDKFCFWVFDGLNLKPEDEFCDLFPGSGAVGRAWEKWKAAQDTPEQFELAPEQWAAALPVSAPSSGTLATVETAQGRATESRKRKCRNTATAAHPIETYNG